jgi:formylglycine-generating enzyme required for sulfatase activity
MNKKTMNVVISMMCLLAFQGLAEPTITDVVAKQRWPWSRLVDIDYVVTGEQGTSVDVSLTAKDGATTLPLPVTSLTGDLNGVTPGLKRIVWDPTQTVYTNNLLLTQFNVTLTPIAPPLYMIIDLTKSAGASNQIEYVTEAALTNDQWGAWVRNPVTNNGTAVQSVIWTGVTTNTTYKTDKLVLRRIPAGSYQLGDTQNGTPNVTLTKDMYVGVFEVTQQQWNRVMTDGTGTDTQAKHTVSYYDIRENWTTGSSSSGGSAISPNWPQSNVPGTNSFVGKLRTKTGIAEFDLPTEAQWEYLCRAKTTTVFNDGDTNAVWSVPGTSITNNGNTNDFLNALGWYKFSPNPGAAQPVGGKLPNAWGLYDTHGNVWEWCLDWKATNADLGTDPDGAESGSDRVLRGGSWSAVASSCRSAFRNSLTPSLRDYRQGFRLVRTLP